MAGKKLVVVSDLHVDRWQKESKFEQFEDFLLYVQREAHTLVVNGDTLDLPPIEGEEVSASSKRALLALLQVPLRGVRLVYVVGNHDIAFRGWPINLPLSYASSTPSRSSSSPGGGYASSMDITTTHCSTAGTTSWREFAGS